MVSIFQQKGRMSLHLRMNSVFLILYLIIRRAILGINMNNPVGNTSPMIERGSGEIKSRLYTENGVVVILLNPIIIPQFEKMPFILFSKRKVDRYTLDM